MFHEGLQMVKDERVQTVYRQNLIRGTTTNRAGTSSEDSAVLSKPLLTREEIELALESVPEEEVSASL